VNEGSALLLQGSLIAAPGANTVILASGGSVLGLAGGNVICNGTLSGSTCTPGTGKALQIQRVSSLVQVNASEFGYTPTAETVYGGGGAQLQSTIDLGVGFPNSVASITWTQTGNTAVENVGASQNSSFRVEGGVVITGAVTLSQASNGFANLARTTPKGNTAPNTVGSISCPFSFVPASHLAITNTMATGPQLTETNPAGTVTIGTNFLTVQSNPNGSQCLSF
jgi:hypothetical protein